jgi:hypothetical protein
LSIKQMELSVKEAPVDVCVVIKLRLEELGQEQRDLAVAAEASISRQPKCMGSCDLW